MLSVLIMIFRGKHIYTFVPYVELSQVDIFPSKSVLRNIVPRLEFSTKKYHAHWKQFVIFFRVEIGQNRLGEGIRLQKRQFRQRTSVAGEIADDKHAVNNIFASRAAALVYLNIIVATVDQRKTTTTQQKNASTNNKKIRLYYSGVIVETTTVCSETLIYNSTDCRAASILLLEDNF